MLSDMHVQPTAIRGMGLQVGRCAASFVVLSLKRRGESSVRVTSTHSHTRMRRFLAGWTRIRRRTRQPLDCPGAALPRPPPPPSTPQTTSTAGSPAWPTPPRPPPLPPPPRVSLPPTRRRQLPTVVQEQEKQLAAVLPHLPHTRAHHPPRRHVITPRHRRRRRPPPLTSTRCTFRWCRGRRAARASPSWTRTCRHRPPPYAPHTTLCLPHSTRKRLLGFA